MKKLILSILFVVTLLTASSQKVYFVYIQSESEQPFFVKMKEKIHSSTNAGYLILSKLVDSTYNFSVGFPQNKLPEQNFSVVINKKDHGFILKQFGEKGWGIYNLQTLSVQMASNAAVTPATKITSENNDVSKFTEILSKVADDPSIKEKPKQPKIIEKMAEVVEKKIETEITPKVAVVEKTEAKSVVIEKSITVKADEKPVEVVEKKVVEKVEPSQVLIEKSITEKVEKAAVVVVEKKSENKTEPKVEIENIEIKETENIKLASDSYTSSTVKKWSESSTTEGFGLVFIDNYENGSNDTIRLFIANPKQIEIPVLAKVETKDDKKFIDIESKAEKKNDETELTEVKPVKALPEIKKTLSNNCIELADENDFLKLRKQMAAKETNEEMITEAQEYFKTKCFSSEQIKNLGALFLSDQSKYKFFDEAYNFVSDSKNFPALQNELKEEYYINRFKAMLRN